MDFLWLDERQQDGGAQRDVPDQEKDRRSTTAGRCRYLAPKPYPARPLLTNELLGSRCIRPDRFVVRSRQKQ